MSNKFLGLDTLKFITGDTDVSRELAASIYRVTDFSLYLDVIVSSLKRIELTLKFRCKPVNLHVVKSQKKRRRIDMGCRRNW